MSGPVVPPLRPPLCLYSYTKYHKSVNFQTPPPNTRCQPPELPELHSLPCVSQQSIVLGPNLVSSQKSKFTENNIYRGLSQKTSILYMRQCFTLFHCCFVFLGIYFDGCDDSGQVMTEIAFILQLSEETKSSGVLVLVLVCLLVSLFLSVCCGCCCPPG